MAAPDRTTRPHHATRPDDPVRNDPHLRGGLSADYAEPGAPSAPDRRLAPKSRSRLWPGLFGALVVGLLVMGMLSMTGLFNAGAPIDETVTSSVYADGDTDVSSALPDAELTTPSTLPATE